MTEAEEIKKVEEIKKIEKNLVFFVEDLISDQEISSLLLNPLIAFKTIPKELAEKIHTSFDGQGRTLVHRLCQSERLIDYLEPLLQRGIRSDLLDREKNSLAHYAARSSLGEQILEQIKSYHPSLNSPNQSGLTPLQLTVLYEQYKVMKLLLKMGADPFQKNSEGVNLFEFIDTLSDLGDYKSVRQLVYDFLSQKKG